MAATLTERGIKAAKAAGGTQRRVLWDDQVTGFGLRLFPSGSASWIFQFRPRGAKRGTPAQTVTIGAWPTLAIAEARNAARALAGQIAMGADPAAELRKARLEPRRVLSRALDDYEAALRRRRVIAVALIMSALRRGLAPFAAREVETLTRAAIMARVEALEAAGKPGAATRLRSNTRTFLEWCLTRGLVPFNPLAGLRHAAVSRADRLDDAARKGKALSDDEIRAVWAGCEGLVPFGGLVKLGLLTGMRRAELAGLTWSDVLGDRIVIPAARAKTGVTHQVPLTPLMRNVLAAQPRTTSPLVFPSARRTPSTQMSGWTQLVKRLVRASNTQLKLHDLRRTLRSRMSMLGVSEEVAELAIGHLRKSLIATYNKDDAWMRRVDAFERVSIVIAGIVTESGEVIQMREA